MISTDSGQRSSRALDSALWSGEPNPTGLWAPVAPELYRGGGGYRGKYAKTVSCPLTHLRDYRPSECRKRREVRRYYTTLSLHQVDLDHSSASDGVIEVTEAIEKVFFYRK